MYAATGEMPAVADPEEALTKAFSFFGITDRSMTPDRATLDANYHFLLNDNLGKVEEVQKHYDVLVNHYWPPDGAIDYTMADYSNPIGLVNIGNTCYLNSLLQYFFAIKPFRDLVLQYDLHKQEVGSDDTKYGKVVTEITREHVLKAQECEWQWRYPRTSFRLTPSSRT
jgi:ubiquitin carboxyl-terminal hydrolase 25/28